MNIEKEINSIYILAINEVLHAVKGLKLKNNKPFTFSQYPKLQSKVDKIFNKLSKKIIILSNTGTETAWKKSNLKNQKEFAKYLSNAKIEVNKKALATFQKRKLAGMGLSDRVWKYTEQFKQEIEMGLDLGLKSGVSANELSRDLRANLKEPNRLYRRVANAYGVLHLSKNAKAYNPGRGVYRSSYKNAMRLTRTEINMAYRTADIEQYREFDFVLGYEVKRSNNVFSCSVCESLKGKYPKTFKFVGWHPQCRCYTVPILTPMQEFEKQQKAIKQGKKYTPSKQIKTVPNNFKQWVRENSQRITTAKQLPYFLRDNKKFWEKEIKLKPIAETKKTNLSKWDNKSVTTKQELNKYIGDYANKYPKMFHYGFKKIVIITNPNANGLTDLFGSIGLKKDIINKINLGITNINKGIATTFEQEKALATLYHEITHNRHTLTRLYSITKKQRAYMETANEFVARKRLPNFMEQLGGKLHNTELMSNRTNTGYNTWVRNYEYLANKCGADMDKVLIDLENTLLNTPYDKQKKGLVDAIKNNSKANKGNVNKAVSKILEYLNEDDFIKWLDDSGLF